ncbi:MAG: hypothetical protein GY940_29535 [bacterium]|nr:hypothetical protein [bacterium]
MKIVTIVVLLLATGILSFLLYENTRQSIYREFPVKKIDKPMHEAPFVLYLYVFFSVEDYPDRLDIVPELNRLPKHFVVTGVVPDGQLKDEKKLRLKTGVEFPLIVSSKYDRYIPFHTPTIVGSSGEGKILFVFSLIPGEKENIQHFLYRFYQNIYPSLIKDKA